MNPESSNRLHPRIQRWIGYGVVIFLLVVAAEQGWKYSLFRSRIGMHAYSFPYALRIMGKKGEYIGRVVDVRWNAKPDDPEDIRGWQPRYQIARETVAGTTETRWLCAYLVECSTQSPPRYAPSPFPKIAYEDIAYR